MEKGLFFHIYSSDENVNAEKYRETLSSFIPFDHLLTSCILWVGSWKKTAQPRILHTIQTQEFMSDNNAQILQSPPYSPDLWAIENVWQIFKHNVEKKKQVWTSCEIMSRNSESC